MRVPRGHLEAAVNGDHEATVPRWYPGIYLPLPAEDSARVG